MKDTQQNVGFGMDEISGKEEEIQSRIREFVNSKKFLDFCKQPNEISVKAEANINSEEIKNINIQETGEQMEFETLTEAKEKGHVKTDILDEYAKDHYDNVRVSKKTIYKAKGKEIYKAIINKNEWILKAVYIDKKQENAPARLKRIKECFDTMVKLGEEHPYFIQAIKIREVPINEWICVETLMEYGGETLLAQMNTANNNDIKRWMIQSIDAFMYSEERRICHFDIKPQNMVSNNGILKIIDLEASVEFDLKEKVFKALRENSNKPSEFTKIYAPNEAGENRDEWIGDKFDVYCWALTFYQIISNKSIQEISEMRKTNQNFIDEINKNELFKNFDENGIIKNVIAKCLSEKKEERPTFSKIAEEMRKIEEDVITSNPQLVDAINSIGYAFSNYTNNYKNALHYFEIVMNIRIKQLGENHKDTATSYINIASAFKNLGHLKVAFDYFERGLNIRLTLLGEDDIDTAKAYNAMADIYFHSGDYMNSIEFSEKALNIRLVLLGENHKDTAASYNNIGNIYFGFGETKEALKYYETALKIHLSLFGDKHACTATSYDNVANAYNNLGDQKKALDYYEIALNIRRALSGEEHTDTAASYNNIGIMYWNSGDGHRALEYNKKALNIQLKLLEEEHTETAKSYINIANDYTQLGNMMKGLEYYEKALNIQLHILGEEHADTATSYDNIALIESHRRNYQRSIEYNEKALKTRIKLLGENSIYTANSYYIAAVNNLNIGDRAKALIYAQKAMEISLPKLREDHPKIIELRRLLESIT